MRFAKLTLFESTASAAQLVFHFPVRVTYSGTLRSPYTPFSRSESETLILCSLESDENEITDDRFSQCYGLCDAGALSWSAKQSHFIATADSPGNMRGV